MCVCASLSCDDTMATNPKARHEGSCPFQHREEAAGNTRRRLSWVPRSSTVSIWFLGLLNYSKEAAQSWSPNKQARKQATIMCQVVSIEIAGCQKVLQCGAVTFFLFTTIKELHQMAYRRPLCLGTPTKKVAQNGHVISAPFTTKISVAKKWQRRASCHSS